MALCHHFWLISAPEALSWRHGNLVPSPSSTAMQQLELKVSVCLQKRGMDKERIVKHRAHLGHE